MKQTITVRAIIKEDQKILLLRRATGNPLYQNLYELPGGKVDFGEDPKATIHRETFEETGSEIETLQLFDVYSQIDPHDTDHQYLYVIFLATLTPHSKIVLSSEHNKYAWKRLSEIQLSEITEWTRIALQLEGESPEEQIEKTEIQKDIDVLPTSKHARVVIYADGGSRGNPGPSASGFVIQDEKEQLVFEGGNYLGITTNNQAEYQAVKLALEKALELGAREVSFRIDSQLVANQLNGIYQIKNRDLWPIYTRIKELVTKFDNVTFTHVRREFNKEADAMVNKILDEHK
ncbi:MAG: reverse transcriptase-like protein [Candidatus Saccharimonadales bacterium]